MDEATLDKLIADIQDFLRGAGDPKVDDAPRGGAPARDTGAPAPTPTARSLARSARMARLLEVCAYGWLACIVAVVGYLVWAVPPRDASGVAQVILLCTFGLFTTLTLLGGSHRLAALLRIERNAREILRLRRRQNALISRLLDRS